MAEHSYFFNSTPEDKRWYLAQDFANYFADVLSSGILPPTEGEDVGFDYQLPVHRPMSMRILGGKALIKGHRYVNEVLIGVGHELTFEPHTALWSTHRIDRVVLRLDHRNSARNIRLAIKQGTTEPPSLQRDHEVYELSLYQVRINAGVSAIDHQDITDERADETVCGFANSLINVPTSAFQQQFDAWFGSYKDGATDDFNEWFASIENILNDNAAGNLLREIRLVDGKKADKTEVNALATNKVDKVNGKQLSTNDYTSAEKTLVAQIPQKANLSDVAKIAVGTPLFVHDTTDMSDTTRLYVNLTDGFIYIHVDGVWTNTQVQYQAAGGEWMEAMTEENEEWIV